MRSVIGREPHCSSFILGRSEIKRKCRKEIEREEKKRKGEPLMIMIGINEYIVGLDFWRRVLVRNNERM